MKQNHINMEHPVTRNKVIIYVDMSRIVWEKNAMTWYQFDLLFTSVSADPLFCKFIGYFSFIVCSFSR